MSDSNGDELGVDVATLLFRRENGLSIVVKFNPLVNECGLT